MVGKKLSHYKMFEEFQGLATLSHSNIENSYPIDETVVHRETTLNKLKDLVSRGELSGVKDVPGI